MSSDSVQPLLDSAAVNNTEIKGIFQSDLIVRSALKAAIDDVRANEWLLDYAFASLAQDSLTSKDYGFNDIARAKEWFRGHEIQIRLDVDPNPPVFPCISVLLAQSVEEENTLGDVHHQTIEGVTNPWPVLAGPFTPLEYHPITGVMTLPADVAAAVDASVGMVVLDRAGVAHAITQVKDASTIVLAAGTVADFNSATIKASSPAYGVQIESASFKETYSIGCAVDSAPIHLIYLHSLVVFLLLRYRQDFLEARGFERSALASTETRKNPVFDSELVFSRYIALTGYARQSWPKRVRAKVASLKTQLVVQTGEAVPVPPGTPDADDLSWISDQDSLAFLTK